MPIQSKEKQVMDKVKNRSTSQQYMTLAVVKFVQSGWTEEQILSLVKDIVKDLKE